MQIIDIETYFFKMSIFLLAFFMCNFILVQAYDPFSYNKKDPCSRHCMYDYHVPVCGSDGVTYFNECVMKVYACWAGVDTTVLHHGKCFPKQVERSQCEHHCSKVMSPVCGTDGKTYNNECLLNQERCYNGPQLTKQYDGFCLTKNSYTAACGRQASLKYHPVCGTDGVSYLNKDALSKTACHNLDFYLRVKSFGECGYKRKARKRCRSVMKKEFKYEPVCGSDYKTHENTAVLEYRKCLRQPAHLTVMYTGECRFKSKGKKKNRPKEENPTTKQQPTNSPTSTKNTPTLPIKPRTLTPPPPPPPPSMPPTPPPLLTTTAPVKKRTTHYTPTTATMADRPTDDRQTITKRPVTRKSLVTVSKTDTQTVSKTNRASPMGNESTDMVTDRPIATKKISSPTNVIILSNIPSADDMTSPSDRDATPSDTGKESTRGVPVETVSYTIQESTMMNKVTDMITVQPIVTEESLSLTNATIQSNTSSDSTPPYPEPEPEQKSTQSHEEAPTSDVVTVSNAIKLSTTINKITDMITVQPIVTEESLSPTNANIQLNTSSDSTPPYPEPEPEQESTQSHKEGTTSDVVTVSNAIQESTMMNKVTDMITVQPIVTEESLSLTNATIQSNTSSDSTPPYPEPEPEQKSTQSHEEVPTSDVVTVSNSIKISTTINKITDMITVQPIVTEESLSPTNANIQLNTSSDSTPPYPEPEPEQESTQSYKEGTTSDVVTVSNAIKRSTTINKITDMVTDQPIITEESSLPTNATIRLNTDGTPSYQPEPEQDSTQLHNEGTTSDLVTVSNAIKKSTTINKITDIITDESVVTEKVSSPTNAIIQSSTSNDGTPPSDMDATSSDIKFTKNDVDIFTAETPIKTQKMLLQTNVISDITELLTPSQGTTLQSDLDVDFTKISKSKPPKIEDKSVPWGYWKITPFPYPRPPITENGSQEMTNIITERITILETILSGTETATPVNDIANTQVKETFSSVEHADKEELKSTTNLDKDTSSGKFFTTEEPLKMPIGLHLTDKTNVEATSMSEMNTVGDGRFEGGFVTL